MYLNAVSYSSRFPMCILYNFLRVLWLTGSSLIDSAEPKRAPSRFNSLETSFFPPHIFTCPCHFSPVPQVGARCSWSTRKSSPRRCQVDVKLSWRWHVVHQRRCDQKSTIPHDYFSSRIFLFIRTVWQCCRFLRFDRDWAGRATSFRCLKNVKWVSYKA